MQLLVTSVFLTSVLGSLHCAGMCGAFVTLAVNGNAKTGRWKTQAAYHVGRLGTYLTLGAIAGSLGAMLDLAGTLAGVQPFAAALAGAIMIGFGVITLLRLAGFKMQSIGFPPAMQRWLVAGHRVAMDRGPIVRAGLIGLLTTLLPCGWLYAFVVVAAGTAHPAIGASTMFVFWLGTLPILVALGSGVQHALGALGRRLPAITAMLVIMAGTYTLLGRSSLDAMAIARAVEPTTKPATQAVVPSLGEVPPCCRGEESK